MATNLQSLVSLIRAAAHQRRLMVPWLDDRYFLERGGTLVHAVDTDVIVLYMKPEESVTLERREGYAEVFPDDDRFLAEALGSALARHIFYQLEHSRPLLVLPPMEQEITRVFNAVSRSINSEQIRARGELNNLRRLVSSLGQEKDQRALLERLDSKAPTLWKLLKGARGPSAAMGRLRHLFRDIRITPLDFALEKDWISDLELRHAMETPTRFADMVELIDLRDAWYSRLLKSKSVSGSRVKIHDDATVLARLEWINGKRLDQERYRFVLITGDSAIHKAARAYSAIGANRCFGDLYLRHPRAYLAEPGVLSPESSYTPGSPESKLLGWLDTFLAECYSRGTSYRAELDELTSMDDRSLQDLAAPVLKIHPGIVEEFRQRWASYNKNLILIGLEVPTDETSSVLSNLRHDIKTILQRVDDLLRRRVWETWEDCFKIVMDLGYGMLFYPAIARELRSRNPPALIFETFPEATEFLEKMLKSRMVGKLDSDYQKDLETLLDRDPSRYTYFLAYAVLFAAEGIWHVAAALAQRAMEISDSTDIPRISGREAAYMRAVALRHDARRLHDLAEVARLIDEAERRLLLDRKDRPTLNAGEIRFEAERSSLNLTYHLFALFMDYRLPEGLPNLAEIQNELQRLLERLNHCAAKPIIFVTVERNLLTNLFMTALLRRGKLHEAVEPGEFRPDFGRFEANIKTTMMPPIKLTFLVQVIYSAAGWWISEAQKEKRWFRRALINELSEDAIKNHAVFRYDIQRFRFLRDFVTASARL